MLALGGGHQVLGGGADAAQLLEPQLGVLLLVVGGLLEERGDLLKPVLADLARVVGVLVPGLALTAESFQQVDLGHDAYTFTESSSKHQMMSIFIH